MVSSVLITGATGFFGRHLTKEALGRGLPVVATFRRHSALTAEFEEQGVLTVRSEDLFEEPLEWWVELLSGVDSVIHAAWPMQRVDYVSPEVNLKALDGSKRIAQAATLVGLEKLVGIGSCYEYDLTERTPLSHDSNERPNNPYGLAKLRVQRNWNKVTQSGGVEMAWCRPFFLYGDGERVDRLFPTIVNAVKNGERAFLTHGEQVRDYLPAEVAASKVLDVLLGDYVGVQLICSGEPVTVRDFAKNVEASLGAQGHLVFGTRPENSIDPPYVVGVPSL